MSASRAAAWRRAGALAVAVAAVDQLTKALATGAVRPGDRDAVFPGIELVNVRNHGIAFGLAPGSGAVVLAVTGVALALLLVYFARHADRPLAWLPTGLLVGGALGNLADRVRLGAVRDFIDPVLWPAFNLADVAITVGILALLYVVEGER
jgi:signal peptidase II